MIERMIELKNGTKLFVTYKKEQAPAILFLHFSGGTSKMWNSILPQFADDYTVVAPDIRGQGRSDHPETGYHIDDMAHDLYLLLQELEISRCHVVGSSMGAEVGLSLAANHPKLVASLVCEGAIYNEFGVYGLFQGSEQEITEEKEKRRLQLNERKVPVFSSKEDFVDNMVQTMKRQGFYRDSFLPYIKSCAEKTEEGTYISHYKNFVRSEYMQNYWDMKFEDYYKRVSCPILFLPSGWEWENERIRHSLEAFASLVTNYEIHLIKDSSHAFVWMQQTEEAGVAVKKFIGKVEKGLY